MNKRIIIPVFVLLLAAVGIHLNTSFGPSSPRLPGEHVRIGPLTVWTEYEGTLEARRVKPIMPRYRGSATIVELAPDGESVREGDLLVRFDSSKLEFDVVRLKRDYALAKSEFEALKNAHIPLELRELEMHLLEARTEFNTEHQYLLDSKDLLAEELVSEHEVEQQQLLMEKLQAQVETLEAQLKLTQTYLHPSLIERANATLASAEHQLQLAERQFQYCTVNAPSDGLVVYKPLHIGGEFRTVRVGDTIYRNQVFMYFPDMSDLLVHCYVPEAELARVAEGDSCTITPLAYPDLQLKGHVENVGFMAQAKPGIQQWQKYFHVVIGLEDTAPRLRTDMSVQARVYSYHHPAALLIPRTAIWWDEDTPWCEVRRGRRTETRNLKLGQGNPTHYEVLSGLEADEFVVIQ